MMKLEEGQRVKIKPLAIKGVVTYINQKDYFNHHMRPIQVELDKPYDESGQTTYRTNMFEIVKLKKKDAAGKPKKKRVAVSHVQEDEDVFDFTSL